MRAFHGAVSPAAKVDHDRTNLVNRIGRSVLQVGRLGGAGRTHHASITAHVPLAPSAGAAPFAVATPITICVTQCQLGNDAVHSDIDHCWGRVCISCHQIADSIDARPSHRSRPPPITPQPDRLFRSSPCPGKPCRFHTVPPSSMTTPAFSLHALSLNVACHRT